MTFFRASQRDLLTAFFSLAATLLHTLCCLLPLYASFAAALERSLAWNAARPYLLAVQALIFLYCIVRILAAYPKLLRVRIYIVSALVSLPGIGLGLRDTFRSPEQEQATHILDNLKYQESVTIEFRQEPDLTGVKEALGNLPGVKWRHTEWNEDGLIVHYHSGMISQERILQALAENGFHVKNQVSDAAAED